MKTKLYILSLLLLSLAACTDDELCLSGNTPSQTLPEGYYFILSTSDSPTTRVVYADQNTSRFEEGDQVGIFAINDTDAGQPTLVTGTEGNARYQVQEVTNTNGSTSQVLVPTEGTTQVPEGCRYIFYYPYHGDMTLEKITALTHTVESNQNEWTDGETHSVTPYEYSDLLWDVESEQTTSTGQAYVEVAMDHAMANIILEIDESYLKKGSTVDLLNVLTTAKGINLSTTSLEALNYSAIGDKSDITMWSFGYATSGNQAFRAAIPAQSLTKGTKLFRIINAEGQKRVYSLSEDIKMEPGKNYIFRVIKGSLQPELNDDDSWVLDVLDPETGEPVGLLCREYLRYQPDNTSTTDPDKKTGTITNNGKFNINSQAWVFYNLKPGTTIPDLNKGTVLRFIYDIHMWTNAPGTQLPNDQMAKYAIWPLPHHQKNEWSVHQGAFTPEHGFQWVKAKDEQGFYGISASEVTGQTDLTEDDLKEENYGMHGGTISWNGQSNQINDFQTLASNNAPTNYEAKEYGHIAINTEGDAFISYDPLNEKGYYDVKGNKVGVLMHHYLIDKRKKSNGSMEINRYPLVKIGYNQFWMSKSLQTTLLIDGTEITCYNKKGDSNNPKPAELNFTPGTDKLDMGYIYMVEKDVESDNGVTNYDPYNDEYEMKGGGTTFRPAPLYNKFAVCNEKFIPKSEEYKEYYLMPTSEEIKDMANYFGFFFMGKMATRNIAERSDYTETAYKKYTALTRGEICHSNVESYTANISGFNLRAIGYCDETGTHDAGYTSSIILKSDMNRDVVEYLMFYSYQVWDAKQVTDILIEKEPKWNAETYISNFFAQVRLLMKYRNQADTGGSSSISTSSATRSLGENVQSESRNIYIPIQPAD